MVAILGVGGLLLLLLLSFFFKPAPLSTIANTWSKIAGATISGKPSSAEAYRTFSNGEFSFEYPSQWEPKDHDELGYQEIFAVCQPTSLLGSRICWPKDEPGSARKGEPYAVGLIQKDKMFEYGHDSLKEIIEEQPMWGSEGLLSKEIQGNSARLKFLNRNDISIEWFSWSQTMICGDYLYNLIVASETSDNPDYEEDTRSGSDLSETVEYILDSAHCTP